MNKSIKIQLITKVLFIRFQFYYIAKGTTFILKAFIPLCHYEIGAGRVSIERSVPVMAAHKNTSATSRRFCSSRTGRSSTSRSARLRKTYSRRKSQNFCKLVFCFHGDRGATLPIVCFVRSPIRRTYFLRSIFEPYVRRCPHRISIRRCGTISFCAANGDSGIPFSFRCR